MNIGKELQKFKDNGGAITGSLLPNGISASGNAKFSLMFGLTCRSNVGIVNNILLRTLMIQIIEFIKSETFSISYGRKEISIPMSNYDNMKMQDIWNNLRGLDNFKCMKCKKPESDKSINRPFFELEDKILEKLLEVPYDPITHISLYLKEKLGDRSGEFTKQDIVAYANSLRNEVKNRNILYDSLDAKGREVQRNTIEAASDFETSLATECSNDIIEAIQYILGYPQAARTLGLIYDFEVVVEDYFSNRENDEPIAISLIVNSNSDFFKLNNENELDKKNFKAYKKGDKLFHGLYNKFTDYSCYKLGSNRHFYFNTINPEQNIQTANFNAEALHDEYVKGKSIVSNKKFNIPRTEGIVLTGNSTYVRERNEVKTDDPKIEPKIEYGILGYSIAVRVLNEDNKEVNPLTSLCKRVLTYEKIEIARKENSDETGWLCNEVSMEAKDGSYDPQVIFSWNGSNLCIESVDKPPALFKDEKEREYEKIFSVKYSQPKAKKGSPGNIMLVKGRTYEFLMHDVYANGYSMPLRTSNEKELSLIDLLNEESLVGKFKLDLNDPIRTPLVIATEEEHKAKRDSIDSIVLRGSRTKAVRYLYPPPIDMQYAFYLGFLTPEFTKAETLDQYVEKTYALLERAKLMPPLYYDCDQVSYLPDIRSERLYFFPGDWFTATCFREMKKNEQFGQLKIDNGWKVTNFDELKEIKPIKLLVDQLPYDDKSNHLKCVSKGRTVRFSVKEGRVLTIAVQSGLPEKRGDCSTTPMTMKELEGTLFETCYPEELKYPRHNLVISNASFGARTSNRITVTPEKIVANRPDTSRPDVQDPTKILFDFVANHFDNFETDKIQAISSVEWLNDVNQSIPFSMFEESREDWRKQSKNRQSDLLENECPASVFRINTLNLVEEEVYKNSFGIAFHFDDFFFKRYEKGMRIIDFKFAQDSSMEIIYDRIEIDNMHYAKVRILGIELSNYDIPLNKKAGNKITFHYNFNKCSSPLELDILINDAKFSFHDSKYQESLKKNYSDFKELLSNRFQVDRIPLPYSDLSEKYLSLSQDLLIKYCTYLEKDANLAFLFNNEFFLYRSEPHTGYRGKSYYLKASSRLSDLQDKDINNSIYSKSFAVIVPNNKKPLTPVFSITPLIAKTNIEKEDIFIEKEREFQLMFEIERPRQNEEYFGLVISNDKLQLDKYSSQIGRDFTTFNGEDKDDSTILNFRLNDKFTYLQKYVHDILSINYDDNFYHVQLFETFFDYYKDKWIFVIDLNDYVKEHKLYNPFLKVVAVNCQTKLSTRSQFVCSEFSKPKYIPLFSPRKVNIKRLDNVLELKIDQNAITKMGEKNVRSHFAVCCREQSANGILGNTVKSKMKEANAWNERVWHEIKIGETHSLNSQDELVICVYEFESFDNTITPFSNALEKEILDNYEYRLVYAEEF